jgi:signal transduction histidine kinase
LPQVPKSSSGVLLFPQQPALQLIYDTAPIGLACLSLDCRYLQINQRLTEICGISVEDHLGRFVRDCVPALADAVEEIVRSIMETGEPVVGIEVAGQRADQVEERFWMTYWHPLRAPGGEIVAVNVAEQEIRSARDTAETALRHLRETQDSLIEARKLAALGRMVAGVAHEVNTPIGTSLTVASTLQRKTKMFSAEAARGSLRRSSLNAFVGLIEEASSQLVANLGRAAELVQSFKQVAIDQQQFNRRTFDPGGLTEQVLSHLQRELRKSDITVKLNCAPELSMDSYPGAFGQVLTNLAFNSMTHAFPAGTPGIIDVEVRAAGSADIELVFADNGCGMPDEIKRLAFDPFFTTRRHQGATGLGLHIVHTIVVEQLGGQLKLESGPGMGTVVRMILPRIAPAGPGSK